MNVTDRGYSVKRSISVDVGAAASAQISSFTWLLGNKEALRLIVTNIIGKKRALACNTSLLNSAGYGVSRYLFTTYISLMSGKVLGKTAATKAMHHVVLGIRSKVQAITSTCRNGF